MSNRLADETSPYLRQHADNPVDWHPWGPEALALAVKTNRPVLLSVGYSACHWCHVMAHESFEDPATAAKMNELFVNVKVDREERPDIDALYMDAVQGMTGRGGWPMTVVMTPEGEPFFAGTYFPPEPRHGMPSFTQVLDSLADAWANRRDEVVEQAGSIRDALVANSQIITKPGLPDRRLVGQAVGELVKGHDAVNGGFGSAPKFPNPLLLDVLFRHHATTGSGDALEVAQNTLAHMAAGGIYDHLGGGFSRYSVDDHWAVPHFEKMLYDNALLVAAYLYGWLVTGDDDHLQVVAETIDYVLRDLRLPGGGIAAAEDADSEGGEGKFYAWTEAELAAVLSREELELARDWYGVSAEGNFEGANVLHRPVIGALARPAPVEALRQKLFTLRAERIRPGLDDKVLTEWNALMISALAEAGAVAGEPAWVQAAAETMDFLLENLTGDSGRWHRSWQADGGRRHLAYAADYAAVVDALTRLGEATGQARWHERALTTAEAMLDLFGDTDGGGLFTNGSDDEELLVRRKDVIDNPIPAANSNAAFALLRLAAIHERPDLAERADEMLRLVAGAMGTQPQAFGRLLAAFDIAAGGTTEIVIAGDRPDLLAEARSRYLPNAVLLHGERFASPLWEDRDGDQAFVCRGSVCDLPAGDVETFVGQLTSA